MGQHYQVRQTLAASSIVLSTVFGAAAVFAAEFKEYPVGETLVFAPYGQINQAYQSFDDGGVKTSNILDITGATSRIGFFLKPLSGDQGLSFQFETGLGLRTSNKTSQTFTPDFLDWNRQQLRQVQVIYTSGFGTFRLGQGSMATDGVAESDLGATVVLAKSTIPEMYGAYAFRTSTGALSSVTIGNTFDNFDGLRRLRLRYDTPSFGGFSFAAAYGKEILKSNVNDRYYGFALRYANTFDSLKIKGALGVSYTDATAITHTTTGSVSVLDTRTGLNLAIAAGTSSSGSKASYVWVKGGWNVSLVSAGVTKFLVEGFSGQDYLTARSDSQMWGIGVMQMIDAYNLELFAGYREFSYNDTSATSYRDARAVQIGGMIKF